MKLLPRGGTLLSAVTLGALVASFWLWQPARAADFDYCVCQDQVSLQCKVFQDIPPAGPGKLSNPLCSPNSTDPYSCVHDCDIRKIIALKHNEPEFAQAKMSYCGSDSDLVRSIQDTSVLQKVKGYNGCMPTHCWCKNTGGYCTHDTTDGAGKFFANDAACKTFCDTKNNSKEKGWAELKPLEKTYTNYFADSGDKGCKFSLPPVNVSPYDFTGNIRSEAKGLNKIKFGNSIPGPAQFIGNGIKVLLLFIGSIALVMYIYGGLLWMTAAGNTERISKSKQILVYATLGVIAMLGSYLLVQFVFGTVLKLSV